jgi:UDP-N-acetylmuramyl pentapeptide phosphotransferase/UDP-N-acetylglucosamine-1-phosphate transferase
MMMRSAFLLHKKTPAIFISVVAIESQLFVLSTGIDDRKKVRSEGRFFIAIWSVADVGLPGGVRESRWRPSTAWRR